MPKNSAEVNQMSAVLKVYYDANDWVDNATLIKKLKRILGPPFQEPQAYTKKTQISAYFGFIIWQDLSDQQSKRKITESGRRFYEGLVAKNDEMMFKEIIYSLENQIFGRNVCGVNSDSDIEPPQIFIHCVLALEYLTRQEYGFILWRLDKHNYKIFDLLAEISTNRIKGEIRYPDVPSKYIDAKPITALVNWGFLKTEGITGNQDKITINTDVVSKYFDELKKLRIFNNKTLEKKTVIFGEMEKNVEKSLNDSSKIRKKRLKGAEKKPRVVNATSRCYIRNADVIAEVLIRANGICENCKKKAPFIRKSNNTPYLETHHVIFLSNNGDDTVENAIALCPNCHKMMHFG